MYLNLQKKSIGNLRPTEMVDQGLIMWYILGKKEIITGPDKKIDQQYIISPNDLYLLRPSLIQKKYDPTLVRLSTRFSNRFHRGGNEYHNWRDAVDFICQDELIKAHYGFDLNQDFILKVPTPKILEKYPHRSIKEKVEILRAKVIEKTAPPKPKNKKTKKIEIPKKCTLPKKPQDPLDKMLDDHYNLKGYSF